MSIVTKNYFRSSISQMAKDGKTRVVTVVGQLRQERCKDYAIEYVQVQDKPNHFVDGLVRYPKKALHRTLTLGVAICNPDDEPNPELGKRTALRHIKEGRNVGVIETHCANMLTEDNIDANICSKLDYICDNIDKFIER